MPRKRQTRRRTSANRTPPKSIAPKDPKRTRIESTRRRSRSIRIPAPSKARHEDLDLFDLAPIGYLLLDGSGVILDVNLLGAELLGKVRSRLVGFPLVSQLPAEGRRAFLDYVRKVRKTEATLPCELVLKSKKAATRVLELRSRHTRIEKDRDRILIGVWDVTESRDAAEKLGASVARLRIAVGAAGAGMWEWDPWQGKLAWSDDHYDLLGIAHSILPTFDAWLQCVDDRERPRLQRAGLRPTLDSIIDVEYSIRLSDGTVRWLRTMGRPISMKGSIPKSIGITLDITSLKAIEARLMSLNASLNERTAEAEARANQLRSLMAQLTRAETEEQARLAEILHDHVQQVLVAADLKLAQLLRRSTTDKDNEALVQVSGFVREALQRTSLLSKDYNPRILEESGLLQALMWQASAMREEYGLIVRVDRETDLEPAQQEVRVIVFRAVKELLFNVVKHARTPRARVRVAKSDDAMLEIEVADSGVGFDAHKKPVSNSSRGGQGIPRIRDRILALGGRFELQSADGAGTRAVIRVPVRSRSPEMAPGSATSARA